MAALFINAPAVTDALAVYFVLFALSGLPNAASQIGSSATAQRFCPPELRGRLWGVAGATGAAAAAVGTIGVALLVDKIDIVALFNAQAVVYLSCAILTYALIVRPKAALEPVRDDLGV